MATDPSERAIETSTRELLATLREIERAVEPVGPRRFVKPPTPRGLVEFTSEVAIPSAILVLRTNVAVLERLQRTLRMVGDRDRPGPVGGGRERSTPVRDRALGLTAVSLSRLDDALDDLQRAIQDSSIDRSPEELLAQARRQTEDLEAQLAAIQDLDRPVDDDASVGATVDVEAELDSLRESVDRPSADEGDEHSST